MTVQERFQETSRLYMPAILELLSSLCTRESPRGSSLPPMCAYHMQTGGKRLRALLPLLVAQDLGRDPASLLPFGAACEMLHNATLVHDDLQDGDRLRRGAPTVWARYGAPQAINLGDAMFYYALLLLQELQAPLALRESISRLLLRETLRVIDGQEREFLLKTHPEPTMEAYFEMVEGKTSGLFSLPVAGAALLCEAPPAQVQALAEASRHLGVLFQIQDDFLDLYGDKGRDTRGSDIAEGKRSVLVVHALSTASPASAAALRHILDTPREQTSPAMIEQALEILLQAGSRDFAQREIQRRAALARSIPEILGHTRLHALIVGITELMLQPIRALMSPETKA